MDGTCRSTPENRHAEELHRELQALLGRCLLGLQRYEYLMKAALARNKLEGPLVGIAQAAESREKPIADMTLGQVATEFFNEVYVPLGSPPPEPPEDTSGGVWISTRSVMEVPDEQRAEARADIASFVRLRNEIVHNFIEKHDLQTTDGLTDAVRQLRDVAAEIELRLERLRNWYADVTNMWVEITQQLLSEDFWNALFFEPLVARLKEAERDLAEGGWTPMDAAITLISSRHPKETPRSQGYANWRQVLRTSGHFDVRYEPRADGGRRTWYRSLA